MRAPRPRSTTVTRSTWEKCPRSRPKPSPRPEGVWGSPCPSRPKEPQTPAHRLTWAKRQPTQNRRSRIQNSFQVTEWCQIVKSKPVAKLKVALPRPCCRSTKSRSSSQVNLFFSCKAILYYVFKFCLQRMRMRIWRLKNPRRRGKASLRSSKSKLRSKRRRVSPLSWASFEFRQNATRIKS